MLANAPARIVNVSTFKSREVRFGDRIRNCEDVVLEEEVGVAFLSCDPGRDRWNTVMGIFQPPLSNHADSDGDNDNDNDNGKIWIYNYTTPNLPDNSALRPLLLLNFPHKHDLHPLGIEYHHQTSTLYVINHSRHHRSVLEIFKLDMAAATATHVHTFSHHLLHAPNAIHVLAPGKLLVTNDHHFRAAVFPVVSKVETFSGLPGGTVVYVDVQEPEQTKVLARVPFANGVRLVNASTVAVASSSKAGVYFFEWVPRAREMLFKRLLRLTVSVDNLSLDARGRLLLAGHPSAPSLMVVSKGRARCDLAGSEEEKRACACTAPSWAAEWSEEEGLREVYKNDGGEFCSSSTFVRDVGRGIGMISGLYERGLLVVRE